MEMISAEARDLATRLLTLDASPHEPSAMRVDAAIGAFEELGVHLSQVVGVTGFQALLTQALKLAENEAPWLEPVPVRKDGTIMRFTEIVKEQNADSMEAGLVTLLSHLLGLLILFIGKDQMLGVVGDFLPDAPIDGDDPSSEAPTPGSETGLPSPGKNAHR